MKVLLQITQEVWSIGKTVIITNFRGHFSEIGLCTSVQVAIGIPLVCKLELLGILGVIYDVESGRTNFDDDEIKLLSGYAELVSLAIYNSHTHRKFYGELLKRLKECEDQGK